MSEMNKASKALLRCAYSTNTTPDVQDFYNAIVKNGKVSSNEFCKSLRAVIEHHTEPCDKLSAALAKFISLYRDQVKDESPELRESLGIVIDNLKVMLLHEYRPK